MNPTKLLVIYLLFSVENLPYTVCEDTDNRLYIAMFDHRYSKTHIGWVSANPATYTDNMTLHYNVAYAYARYNYEAVAADYHTGNVTFYDTNRRRIFLSDDVEVQNGKARSIIGGTSGRVDALTVDWLAKNVYFVDEGYNWIRMTNYTGGVDKLIIDAGLERPSGIACHPLKGYLFWTELGDMYPARIERSSMSGKNRTAIVTSGLNQPMSITVDVITDRIYWIDNSETESKIESSDLDGERRRTEVMQIPSLGIFNSISVDDNYIFVSLFANLDTFIRYYTKAFPIKLTFEYYLGSAIKVHDLYVTGARVQPIPAKVPCDGNTCGHFCASAADEKYECICIDRYILLSDGSCIFDYDRLHPPLYLIGGTNAISKIIPTSLHYNDLTDKSKHVFEFYSGPINVSAVAVDIHSNFLFYSDLTQKAIFVTRIVSGQNPTKIHSNTGQVNGMAVDWISQYVYWVDYEGDLLRRSSYDGRTSEVMFYDVIKSNAIAVDSNARLIFWTEKASQVKLVKYDLDRGNRQDLTNLEIQNPTGIVLDNIRKGIYIVGKDSSLVYFARYDGTGQESIGRSLYPASDISIYQDFIVLVESHQEGGTTIETIHKITGESEGILMLDSDVYAIDTADYSVQPIVTQPPATTTETTKTKYLSVLTVPTLPPTPNGITENVSIIVVAAAGGCGMMVILLIVGVIIMCIKKRKRLNKGKGHQHQRQSNHYETELPQLNPPEPTYESLDLKPPTYESVIEESQYLEPIDHKVWLQNDVASNSSQHKLNPTKNTDQRFVSTNPQSGGGNSQSGAHPRHHGTNSNSRGKFNPGHGTKSHGGRPRHDTRPQLYHGNPQARGNNSRPGSNPQYRDTNSVFTISKPPPYSGYDY